jgi:hypothetical protein
MEQIEEHTRLLHGTPAATAAASAFRTARQSPSGPCANRELGLVLDLQQLLEANHCPTKSWGGGGRAQWSCAGCFEAAHR